MRSPIISAIVAGSLLISTTAPSATQPSLPADRSGADVEDADGIVGSFAIIGIIAVLAIVAVVVLLDDDEDEPTSP